ncbi:hypothetical protein BZL30_6589 [Mycobacterium kansasii]|uniref:Uncharacterized protein n=1 Tax=Mycobacterium kansasii TaxID=1768 RepID=A0A1V3WTE6_MYCKA|nr:hypothetical protein BZL30_6589 [Mycobacterium kansasii]
MALPRLPPPTLPLPTLPNPKLRSPMSALPMLPRPSLARPKLRKPNCRAAAVPGKRAQRVQRWIQAKPRSRRITRWPATPRRWI